MDKIKKFLKLRTMTWTEVEVIFAGRVSLK